MNIEINSDLEDVLKARSKEKDFNTTEEYINHLLEQVVDKIRREKQSKESYSSEQEKEVKKRLEDLGYTG